MNLNILKPYFSVMRLDKPIGFLLLLWPTLTALWIAGQGKPAPYLIFIFICGVFLTRAAGCVINDFADRDFDRYVQRTQARALTTGMISQKNALLLCGLLFLSAFLLVLFLNKLTITLSIVALALATIYPFMKRYTHFPQVVLGMAFSWGIPMAFAAQTGKIPQTAWLLYLIAILWTTAYDTMYGMVDRDDDLKLQLKSTAIFFGKYDKLAIGLLQISVLALLIILGGILNYNFYYYAGIFCTGLFFIYQQFLIAARQPQNCFKAFLNNNYALLAVFVSVMVNYSLN